MKYQHHTPQLSKLRISPRDQKKAPKYEIQKYVNKQLDE